MPAPDRPARLLLAPLLAACGTAGADIDQTTGGDSSSSSTASTTTETTGAPTTGGTTGDATTGPQIPPLGPWRIMTFNVMCSSCVVEGFEEWKLRVPHIGDTMRRHDPDLLGVQ